MFTNFRIVYGCFGATRAQLTSWHKAKSKNIWPLKVCWHLDSRTYLSAFKAGNPELLLKHFYVKYSVLGIPRSTFHHISAVRGDETTFQRHVSTWRRVYHLPLQFSCVCSVWSYRASASRLQECWVKTRGDWEVNSGHWSRELNPR